MFVLPVIPYPSINPVLIAFGPIAVRWYALAYIVGIIGGWVYARAIIANERRWGGPAPLTVHDFDDFVVWITLGVILGGRLGYVLFYNLPRFSEHPAEILQLWKGGMSFHGGVFGCIVGDHAVRLGRGNPDAVAGRRLRGGRPDRALPWPHRQFHQWRNCGAGPLTSPGR